MELLTHSCAKVVYHSNVKFVTPHMNVSRTRNICMSHELFTYFLRTKVSFEPFLPKSTQDISPHIGWLVGVCYCKREEVFRIVLFPHAQFSFDFFLARIHRASRLILDGGWVYVCIREVFYIGLFSRI